MLLRMLICAFAVLAAIVSRGFGQGASDLRVLFDAYKWNDLYGRVQNTSNAPLLYRGAMGVAFNQHPEESERLLLSVISKNPYSPEAYEGSKWLSHLYFYRGQYRSLVGIMERRWAAFPDKQERSQEQAEMTGFRGLPPSNMSPAASSSLFRSMVVRPHISSIREHGFPV